MKLTRILSILLSILILLSLSGAYATWHYCEMSLGTATGQTPLKMSIFHWEGSDVLPDDEDTGHAHANLIDKLINGEGIGLNSSKSYLNEQIRNRDRYYGRDTLGSMAITQGDALNTLFDLGTENTTFLIQTINDNLYYIFTTSLDLGVKGNPNYPLGTAISPIYRTTVQRTNGVWVAVKTEEGSAPSAYYEESQWFNITRSKIPSFNPDQWTAN